MKLNLHDAIASCSKGDLSKKSALAVLRFAKALIEFSSTHTEENRFPVVKARYTRAQAVLFERLIKLEATVNKLKKPK